MLSETVKAIADLLELLLPILNFAVGGSQLDQDLRKFEPQMRNELAWTGDTGYLFYVPVGQHFGTGQLTYGGLRARGSGNTPVEVLARSIDKPVLENPVPADLSDEHTIFLWFDATRDEWSFTPPEFVSSLKLQALTMRNDQALLTSLEQKRKNEIYQHALGVLKTRVKNNEAKLLVLAAEQRIDGYRNKISEIENSLRSSLDKAQRAESFLSKLKVVSDFASLAQIGAQIRAEMPDAGVIDDDDVLTIEQKVIEYKTIQDGVIKRYRVEMSLQKQLTNDEAMKLRPLLKESGAPIEIIDWSL